MSARRRPGPFRWGRSTTAAAAQRPAVSSAALHAALPRSGMKPAVWLLALASLLGACAAEPVRQAAPQPAEPLERAAAVTADLSASEGLVYVVVDPEYRRRTDIWRGRLSDGAVQPLIQTPDRGEDQPAWSELAETLVVKIRPAKRGTDIEPGLVLWKAGRELDLPGEETRGHRWATWSPLDARLLFAARKVVPSDGEEIQNAIAVVDVEDGAQSILARGARRDRYYRPAFSPDGRHVVAELLTREPRASRIVLLNGRDEPQILTDTEYRASQPRYTRDGRHIFFTRRNGRGEPRDVMWMRSDGSQARLFWGTPESDDYLPAASPTRDEVAFLSNRDGKLDVFLADLAGGEPRNLTAPLEMRVRKLHWSPDGERLALTAFPYGPEGMQGENAAAIPKNAQVLVIDRQGRLLFRTAGFAADWMPPWS